MMKRYLLYALLITNFYGLLYGQETKRDKEIFPSIMVIPRTNEGEGLRTIIDNNPLIRVGIAAIKDGFDQYGYTTKDFETTFKKIMSDQNVWNHTKKEFKELLFRNNPTDIIIELEIIYVPSNAGSLVRLILEANEVATANSLGTKTCESNRFYTEDIGSLTISAMNEGFGDETTCFDTFMKEILIKWNAQYEEGKNVIINFSVDKNSKWTMDSKISTKDNERLKFIIEDWLNETAFEHYVKIDQVTEFNLSVSEYRYQFMKTSRNVERNIYKFFDKLNIEVKIVNNNGSIYVKIL